MQLPTPTSTTRPRPYPIALACSSMLGLALLAAPQVARATVADNLKSFEGQEPPKVKYIVADDKVVPNPDYAQNITDVGNHTVRMFLHYKPDVGWDGDQSTDRKDRQRAEIKGLGPHQKPGDEFEYQTTWRTDPHFIGGDRFCHVFQLKATNGSDGPPLVTLSILPGTSDACVHYWSGDAKGFTMARKFHWKPGVWQTIKIRIRVSEQKDGLVEASVNGDPFQGVTGVSVYRPDATDYRPKWGLYRGVTKDMPFGDDWVEHKDVSAKKLETNSPTTNPSGS